MGWFTSLLGNAVTLNICGLNGKIATRKVSLSEVARIAAEMAATHRIIEVYTYQPDGSYVVWIHVRASLRRRAGSSNDGFGPAIVPVLSVST